MIFRRVLFVLLAALFAGSLFAQAAPPKAPGQKDPGFFGGSRDKKEDDENARSVEGTVFDASGREMEGAFVKVKDLKTLRVRSFLTKEDGKYRFYGLSSNVDYELVADFKGTTSEKKTLGVYDSRKKALINLRFPEKQE